MNSLRVDSIQSQSFLLFIDYYAKHLVDQQLVESSNLTAILNNYKPYNRLIAALN